MQNIVIMPIGGSGVGKSAFGNCFLQKKVFIESDEPDSCTLKANSKCNIIDGIKRHYIDTQGLKSSDGSDESNFAQIVDFLKNWNLGINAFFIVINIQDPRFSEEVKKMIKIINDFFNNPNLWNQTGIIFTKCYEGHFKREPYEYEYQNKVKEFIKTLNECQSIYPQIPCFFVDSCDYEKDKSTQIELKKLYRFVCQNNPVQTNNFVAVKPQYKSIETLRGFKYIKSEIDDFLGQKTEWKYHEYQIITKYTHWNGDITYSKPTVLFTRKQGPYYYKAT